MKIDGSGKLCLKSQMTVVLWKSTTDYKLISEIQNVSPVFVWQKFEICKSSETPSGFRQVEPCARGINSGQDWDTKGSVDDCAVIPKGSVDD